MTIRLVVKVRHPLPGKTALNIQTLHSRHLIPQNLLTRPPKIFADAPSTVMSGPTVQLLLQSPSAWTSSSPMSTSTNLCSIPSPHHPRSRPTSKHAVLRPRNPTNPSAHNTPSAVPTTPTTATTLTLAVALPLPGTKSALSQWRIVTYVVQAVSAEPNPSVMLSNLFTSLRTKRHPSQADHHNITRTSPASHTSRATQFEAQQSPTTASASCAKTPA